jgi:hypothetical protein
MMNTQPLYTPEQLAQLRKEAEEAADRNFAAISQHPTMETLNRELTKLMMANGSARSKWRKLREIALRINEAVIPHTVCTTGCSHCCHISVSITKHEAAVIGEAIGRTPEAVPHATPDKDAQVERYFGKPCTFLEEGRCSIYEHRPLSCILHHSVGASPALCDTRVSVTESIIPSIDMGNFWKVHALLLHDDTFADLREFFPKA